MLIPSFGIGQDQRVADSLSLIYQADTIEGIAKLELLKNLSFNEINDFDLSLQYADDLIQLSEELGNNAYLFQGYFQK